MLRGLSSFLFPLLRLQRQLLTLSDQRGPRIHSAGSIPRSITLTSPDAMQAAAHQPNSMLGFQATDVMRVYGSCMTYFPGSEMVRRSFSPASSPSPPSRLSASISISSSLVFLARFPFFL